jgi:hypothetical protein
MGACKSDGARAYDYRIAIRVRHIGVVLSGAKRIYA